MTTPNEPEERDLERAKEIWQELDGSLAYSTHNLKIIAAAIRAERRRIPESDEVMGLVKNVRHAKICRSIYGAICNCGVKEALSAFQKLRKESGLS